MRLAIFVGLLYVAYCINPVIFDSLTDKKFDRICCCIGTIW